MIQAFAKFILEQAGFFVHLGVRIVAIFRSVTAMVGIRWTPGGAGRCRKWFGPGHPLLIHPGQQLDFLLHLIEGRMALPQDANPLLVTLNGFRQRQLSGFQLGYDLLKLGQ